MAPVERQEKLVLWAYVVQWATLVMPPAIIVSLIYLLLVRGRVVHCELRSHVDWQLMTCAQIGAMIVLGFALLAIGMSGFSTDAPLSIVATFVLYGGSLLFLPWLLYRFLRGTIRFSQQLPMESLFP